MPQKPARCISDRLARSVIVPVLLAAGLAAARADTPSLLDSIPKAGILRVGLTEDYRPFSIADSSGKVEGIDVDMANNLAQSLGVKLEIVKTSWPTLKSDLEAGKFDIAMGGITITLDRQRVGLFSSPVFSSGKTPITHCGDEAKYATLAEIDQPGVRVIVNPGGTNERFDKAHLQKATIVPWPDNATIFDALAQGKADLMITDSVETRLQAKLHQGVLCPVHPDAPFDHSQLGYWMPRDMIFAAYVDQWLNLLDLSGEHQAILARWLQ
ncbi:MAG TPA: transporter substrate-binding domain-containing protein [Acetobacteraceae bacterium]|nr:transporter substrate-binding domain-containing protein [Acetobacteraceae bacterium]